MNRPLNIAIFGSTGSIGRSALEVIRQVEGLKVYGISGHSQFPLLLEQAAEFQPRYVVCSDQAKGLSGWKGNTRPGFPETEFLAGPEALIQLASDPEVDIVLAAIVGIAGLPSTWAAVEQGKRVALANKETLVTAGPLMARLAKKTGAQIIPVDSEHSAIFQCFQAGRIREVLQVVLTASGGPFRDSQLYPAEKLHQVTVEQALAHPTWQMGRKTTIDSATLMNKSLEIIEARWLFDLDPAKIEVVIHPQSIVHSMVQYQDGSTLAQLSPPDMKLPIQYAFTFPDRAVGPSPRLDFQRAFQLDFSPPDYERFPALTLGFEVARQGGTAGVVLNAANEFAVQAFLNRKLAFTDIAAACRDILDQHDFEPHPELKRIQYLDSWARQEMSKWMLT